MSITQQFRQVLRRLLKSPGFTLISILTLALGIGANSAIFSVVDAVLIQPLPYSESERLVGLWHSAPGLGINEFEQSITTYTLYRESARSFEDVALVDEYEVNLAGVGDPLRVPSASITSSTFDVLRATPEMGRRFTEIDERQGATRVLLISNRLWRTEFGRAPDILGRTVRIDDEPWEIIGVMPRGFGYPDAATDLWVPLPIDPEDMGKANFSYDAIARLAPNATLTSAHTEMNQLLQVMPDRYPGDLTHGLMESAQMSALLRPMRDDVVGDVESILWILLGTVGLILLIACTNVANLFLVRAEGRQRDVAVRTALGASIRDLARYFLAESLLLASAAGVLGLLLAQVGVKALISLTPITIPRIAEVGLNANVLAFTAAIAIFAGFTFGLFPLLRFLRSNLVTSLKEGGRGGSSGRESHRARKVLVAAQVALALILLAGSALMARSFWALRNVSPGFEPSNTLTFRLSIPETEYETCEDAARFYRRLFDDLEALPGVHSAGAISNLPMTDSSSNNGLNIEDFPLQADEMPEIVRTNRASADYFKTMGIPILEGRPFTRSDQENRTGAVIVSAALAGRLWPDGSAIGKRVAPGIRENESRWYTIVGVVGDVRDDGPAGDPVEMIYYPMSPIVGTEEDRYNDWISRTMSVAIKTDGNPSGLAPAVREAVWAMNPRLPVANMRTAQSILNESMAPTAFTMLLLGIAAAVALLLGAVGIYGVVSYVVSQRTREIGVRMALGAQRSSVSRMVVGDAMLVATGGVIFGLLGALALTRLMNALLFGVSSTDPLTFFGVAVALFAVTAVASYLPARRAAAVSPLEALRHE